MDLEISAILENFFSTYDGKTEHIHNPPNWVGHEDHLKMAIEAKNKDRVP